MPVKRERRSINQLSQDRSFLLSATGVIIVLLVTMVLIEQIGGAAKLAELVKQTGVWAPIVFILAKALTYVIAPLSGTPVKVIAGTLFGFVPGVIYAVLGDLLGASINFWIARLFGHRAIVKLFSKRSVKRIDEFVAHLETWKTLLAARIILSGFYDFISYTAGLSKLPYKTFFWITLIGGIPASLLAVALGSTLASNSKTFIFILIGTLLLLALSYQAAEKKPNTTKKSK